MNKYKNYCGEMNDLDLARYFIEHHGQNVRWLHDKSCWLFFDGKVWKGGDYIVRNLMYETLEAAAKTILAKAKDKRRTLSEDDDISQVNRMATSARRDSNSLRMTERCRAVLEAAKPSLVIHRNELDRHPNYLNCQNGVINLSDGSFMKHENSSKLYLTRMLNSAYGKEADCPKWKQFVEFLFPDPEVQDYIQRMCGYLLTGYISEQVLFLMIGAGNNGKSMFLSVMQTILNDYAVSVPFEALMTSNGTITPHLDRLQGVRLAGITEVKVGKPWDTGLVKSITGGDTVTVNPKYRDAYQFAATHKFVVLANHKPGVNDNSPGFWRRMHVIPFEKVIEKPQPFEKVLQKFMDESAGILNWCIEGELKRKNHRLTVNMPKIILDAVREYRGEEDVFSYFLSLHYVLDNSGNVNAPSLVKLVNKELEDNGHFKMSAKTITKKLAELGVKRGGSGNMFYYGVREITIEEKDKIGLPVDEMEREVNAIYQAWYGPKSND